MSLGKDDRGRDDGFYLDGNRSTERPTEEPRRRRPMDDERQAVRWLEMWMADKQEGRQPLLVPSVPAG